MDEPVPTYGLLHITRAYNRGEISFDEWLKLSREWAECIISQSRTREQCRVDVKSRSRGSDEVR